jgi:hypothetical protein
MPYFFSIIFRQAVDGAAAHRVNNAQGVLKELLCFPGYHPRFVYRRMQYILKHMMVPPFHGIAEGGTF